MSFIDEKIPRALSMGTERAMKNQQKLNYYFVQDIITFYRSISFSTKINSGQVIIFLSMPIQTFRVK